MIHDVHPLIEINNWYDQDVSYCCNIDKESYDHSRLQQILEQLRVINHLTRLRGFTIKGRQEQKDKLINEFEQIMRRFYNDQTVFDERKNQIIKPLGKTRKVDRITIQGMARMASIFAGDSRGFYNWMINGGSDITAEVTDWRLYQEFSTTSIIENGYSSGSGTVVKHGAAFSINDEGNTIKEVAARDFPAFNNDQTLWFRAVFDQAGDEIIHVQGRDIVIISHAAHFISVSDFDDSLTQQAV